MSERETLYLFRGQPDLSKGKSGEEKKNSLANRKSRLSTG